jgi:glycosyltransferase involved in cell wall biosynthesis
VCVFYSGQKLADEMSKKPRILYVENLDRYFLTHRLAVVNTFRNTGFEVLVAAGESGWAAAIREQGIAFEAIPLVREGTSLVGEFRLLVSLMRLYRRVRPDLVHHFNLKPITYGTISTRLLGIPVVNTVTGLGQTFAPERQSSTQFRIIKLLYLLALRKKDSRVTFQNPDDCHEFIKMGLIVPGKAQIVPGSGVDCRRFKPLHEPESPPIVAFAARLMWAKGVEDFIHVAQRLQGRGARFVLIGEPDPDNRDSVPVPQIEAWVQEGIIEWWAYQGDMPAALSRVSIVALPSTYREGIPKILLEAAATARAIVTYDMPGCREIVHDGVNGLLVPPRDRDRFTMAVADLLDNEELRRVYGQAGRERALNEFSHDIVYNQFLELYQDLLG